ncbi:MAG: ribosome assembly RNA-binding protein YhbY [Desulfobulbaceae bacterium]|nr:ribosome assembly RNA-binding protein YhbY [Desulfobulbaceae bacterium]
MSKSKKSRQTVTPKQARYLRGLGHHLSPVAMVGREGINDRLVASVDEVLIARELIKVKLQSNCPLDRKEAASILAQKTRSAAVQVLGKTILLFRENKNRKDEGKIGLP